MIRISEFIERRQQDNWFWIALICLACSFLMLDFPIEGVPDGYDLAQHLRFAATYHDALLDGSFLSPWAAGDNFGFGSVGVRFYPPFADYMLAVTQLFTQDWYQSFWLNSVFWMFPGCIGVYFWVKDLGPRTAAAGAAILYAAMPYHLLQVYRFQLYSEFVAAAILPFCFLFATRLVKRGSVTDALGMAVSASLIILTHIPTSLIGFASLGLYIVLILDWKSPLKSIGKFAISFTISISSTAFYLVRLVTEVNWVKHSTAEFSTGFFDYRRHLFPIISNFGDGYWDVSMWLFDLSILMTVLMLIPLPLVILWQRSARSFSKIQGRVFVAISATGIFSILMLSSVSSFVWNAIGVLQKIQFPWRFQSVAMLMGAVSLTLAVSLAFNQFGWFGQLIAYTTISLIFVIVLFDLTQTILMAGPLNREKFIERVVDTREAEGCACWWPNWARKEAFENRTQVAANDRHVEISAWEAGKRELSVAAGEPTDLRVATFFYPYWKATVNSHPVEVKPDENGAILIPVPAEATEVRLYFKEPNVNKVMLYLSAGTWLLLLISIVSFHVLKRRKPQRPVTE